MEKCHTGNDVEHQQWTLKGWLDILGTAHISLFVERYMRTLIFFLPRNLTTGSRKERV